MLKTLAPLWDNPYLRFVLLVLIVAALYLFFRHTRGVWVVLLVSSLLAYLLDPFVSFVARRSHRIIGMLAVLLVLTAIMGLLWLLIIRISAQFSSFVIRLPSLIASLQELPFRTARWIDPTFGDIFQQVYIVLQRSWLFINEDLLPRLTSVGQPGGDPLQQLMSVAGSSAQVAVALVLTLYLLYNFPRYTRSFLRALPHRHRNQVEELFVTAGQAVGGYVRGQLLIALGVGILTGVGLALFGVPLALTLGVLAGLANLIPFLGPLLIGIPTVLLAMTEGTGTVIAAILVLLIINQLDGNLLTPLVFSRVISLDPVTVLLAILLGATLYGLIGAFVAVPAAAFLKVLYTTYYLDSGWYKRPSD